MKKYCIVLASGTGSRFGADVPKQFVKICGKMVIEHTLAACDCGVFDEILLVVSAPYLDEMRAMIAANGYSIPVWVVEGGASRKESCEKGVAAISDEDGFVVVHNGAQPFVKKATFEKCLEALKECPAAVSGIPCTYTVMRLNARSEVREIPDRSELFCDMGEEGFRISLLRNVLTLRGPNLSSANIVGLVVQSRLGQVKVYEGDPGDIKITYQEDVTMAERLLNGR